MLIEKGVPIPAIVREPTKYGFERMEVGDSMFFEGQKHGGKGAIAARVFAHKKGWRMTSRVMDGGVRVWRIE